MCDQVRRDSAAVEVTRPARAPYVVHPGAVDLSRVERDVVMQRLVAARWSPIAPADLRPRGTCTWTIDGRARETGPGAAREVGPGDSAYSRLVVLWRRDA